MAKWTKEDDEVLVTAVGYGLPSSKIEIPDIHPDPFTPA